MGYGIGRVPRDVDPSDELRAELEIAEREAKQRPPADYPRGRKLDCGHTVYYQWEVMSASLGSTCGGCYDMMSGA